MSKNNYFKREVKKERSSAKNAISKVASSIKRAFHTGRKMLSSKKMSIAQKRSQERILTVAQEKHNEFAEDRKKLQFCYLLYQFGFLDLIGKKNAKQLLYGMTQISPYNIHHLQPLELSGTNDFDNLSLINKKLHSFIHEYCLSKPMIELLASLPAEERKELMNQFVPALTPIARTEDFFTQTIVCAAKAQVYITPVDVLKKHRMPISSNIIKKSFPERILTSCSFDERLFNKFVSLNVSYKLTSQEDSKQAILQKIKDTEAELMKPAEKSQPILAEIRKQYNEWNLIADIERHVLACMLIRDYKILPKSVLTEKSFTRTYRKINPDYQRDE